LDPVDGEVAFGDEVPDGVVFYADVLDLRMLDIVVRQVTGCVIIAVEWGQVMLREADAIQKLAKE
jgi:hypothetical protein